MDYYKILNIDKTATEAEIKKAYRKLAMKYHPDHTKGNKEAEDKFKRVSEAYAVLSNKEKRKQYDTFGSSDFHKKYSQEDIFKGADLSDILKEFGFNFGNRFAGGPGRGAKFSFGGGAPHFGGYAGARRRPLKGEDLIYEIPLTIKEVATGCEKIISLPNNEGKQKKISLKIPKGMIEGKKIRLAGKGKPGSFGGGAGDLYIRSALVKNSEYAVNGYDMTFDKEIKLTEALLGAKISVPTLAPKDVTLKIPAGIKHKTKLRLAGLGLPNTNGNKRGDLYVRVIINTPKSLTDEQKTLIQSLADTGL
ncbi:MAG: J domain-containing protein [Deltaproteobacteria bacterium]|nr:J domain-containing protein [Deltaproteobacteria bacterium]